MFFAYDIHNSLLLQISYIFSKCQGNVKMSRIVLRMCYLPLLFSHCPFRRIQQITAREKHIYFIPSEITNSLYGRSFHLHRDAAISFVFFKVVNSFSVESIRSPGLE